MAKRNNKKSKIETLESEIQAYCDLYNRLFDKSTIVYECLDKIGMSVLALSKAEMGIPKEMTAAFDSITVEWKKIRAEHDHVRELWHSKREELDFLLYGEQKVMIPVEPKLLELSEHQFN